MTTTLNKRFQSQKHKLFTNYDLDKIEGMQEDIPIRIQSKIGTIPTKILADYLKSLANEINDYTGELEWKEVYDEQVEIGNSTREQKSYMQLLPDLDQADFLKQKHPLRLISKDGQLDKARLVEHLEKATIRLYAKAQRFNEEELTKLITVAKKHGIDFCKIMNISKLDLFKMKFKNSIDTTINSSKTLFKKVTKPKSDSYINSLSMETLIDLLKNKNHELDDVTQGLYMLRLQELTKLKPYEIAALIDKMPSYVYFRIRLAEKLLKKINIETEGKR